MTWLWVILSAGWLCDSREKFTGNRHNRMLTNSDTLLLHVPSYEGGGDISLLSGLLETNMSQPKEVLALRENFFSFCSSAKGNLGRSLCDLKTTNFVTHPTSPLISFLPKAGVMDSLCTGLHFQNTSQDDS